MILLIVLLATVALCATMVVLTRCAVATAQWTSTSLHLRMADALLEQAEAPILDWLMTRSDTVVLPIDATVAKALVLDDTIPLGAVASRIRIDAFDACEPDRINVSTLPIETIRDALAERHLGGIELIEQARSEGRVPPRPSGGTLGEKERRATFTNVSPRWEMRIEIWVGGVRRRWAAIYQASEEGWTCQERRWLDAP